MHWIDELGDGWQREYPGLDTSALPTLAFLARLSVLLEDFELGVLEPFDLGPSDYSVLATLRRSGEPYELNPNALYSRLRRSSGGMTKMLKRLEQRGLVRRKPDPDDGRGTRVRLTRKGFELQERVFLAFLVASGELSSSLSDGDRDNAEKGLCGLLEAFETRE